jgi:hypothetical protein
MFRNKETKIEVDYIYMQKRKALHGKRREEEFLIDSSYRLIYTVRSINITETDF